MERELLYAVWPDRFQRVEVEGAIADANGMWREEVRQRLLATGAPFWRAYRVGDDSTVAEEEFVRLVEKLIRLLQQSPGADKPERRMTGGSG